MIHGHGGNVYEIADALGCGPDEIVDMSSNVSPIGTVPGLKEVLAEKWNDITRLPEADACTLRAWFAESLNLDENNVLVGNGTTEFIYMIPPALRVKKALVVGPTYSDYADACRAFGAGVRYYIVREENDFEPSLGNIESELSGVDTLFICNPNNPTGCLIPKETLQSFISAHPQVRFVIDESYLPFIPDWGAETLAHNKAGNLVVLHSFSKIFGIPGLRLGFLIASCETVSAFVPFKCPWSVNSLALAAGMFLVGQKSFIRSVAEFVQQERRLFVGSIEGIEGIHVFPSSVHFMLFKLNGQMTAPELFKAMADHKILIRDCANFVGLSDRFFRIAIKDSEANTRCAEALRGILARHE